MIGPLLIRSPGITWFTVDLPQIPVETALLNYFAQPVLPLSLTPGNGDLFDMSLDGRKKVRIHFLGRSVDRFLFHWNRALYHFS